VQNAFGDAAHQFRFGGQQGCFRRGCVARNECFCDSSQGGAGARTAGFVYFKAGFVLTGALFGLGRIGHVWALSGLFQCFSRTDPPIKL